jgi:hypothetical protein
VGKLYTGHYGKRPSAEAVAITLRECHQKLGLMPSDFVSTDPPDFFRKRHGTGGKYLVFELEAKEIDNAVWRPGFYLLPLEAEDVLKAFSKGKPVGVSRAKKPVELQAKKAPPAFVLERAGRWADVTQPLFFECKCTELVLRLDPPWGLRRRWKARLFCAKKCQPAVTTEI